MAAHRALDVRALSPRDYLRDPFAFGIDPWALTHTPVGGDERSRQVAWVQHRVACQFRARNRRGRGPGAVLAHRFGFSRQYFSACLAGQYWMGETVLAAVVAGALSVPDPGPG